MTWQKARDSIYLRIVFSIKFIDTSWFPRQKTKLFDALHITLIYRYNFLLNLIVMNKYCQKKSKMRRKSIVFQIQSHYKSIYTRVSSNIEHIQIHIDLYSVDLWDIGNYFDDDFFSWNFSKLNAIHRRVNSFNSKKTF